MIIVGALIFSGFLSYICATDRCHNETDYDFYMMERLVEDVQERMISLKDNVHAAIHTQCKNMTCPNTTCADGWVSYKGSCYLFENGQVRTFQEARNFCAQFGALLLYVKDEAENKFIIGMLDSLKLSHWAIGLTDQAHEGVWKWSDTNTAVEFTYWEPGESYGWTSEAFPYMGRHLVLL